MDSLRCFADLVAIAGSLRDDINVLDVSENGYHSNRGENEWKWWQTMGFRIQILKLVVLVQGWWINASYEVDVKEGRRGTWKGLGLRRYTAITCKGKSASSWMFPWVHCGTIFLTDLSSSPGYPQNSLFKKKHEKSYISLSAVCWLLSPGNYFLNQKISMKSPETWWGSAFCLYGCITVLFLLAFNELAWISATPHEPTDAEAEQSLQDWTVWEENMVFHQWE